MKDKRPGTAQPLPIQMEESHDPDGADGADAKFHARSGIDAGASLSRIK
jgi:hypothetical protein